MCGCAGSTLRHWPFPWDHLGEGYAYILTHCGTPCVFYDHIYFDQKLRKQVRRWRAGPASTDSLERATVCAGPSIYTPTLNRALCSQAGGGRGSAICVTLSLRESL
jgi:alpha-amylase